MRKSAAKAHLLSLALMALTAAGAASGASAQAPRPPSPWQVTEGDYDIANFKFATGESLPNLHIHYSTLGTPRKDAQGHVTNAIMLLHGTGGTGKGMASAAFGNEVFGPGQVFDITKYFIVLPDGIGHGGSSKPSDGLRTRFPKYDYADMVAAQHALAEHLGIQKFQLIGGQSMGCMHAFVWGETYPDAMKVLLPLACSPSEISGRSRLYRKMVLEIIRSDPAYMDGDYTKEPELGLRAANWIVGFSTSTPAVAQRAYPTRQAADDYVMRSVATPARNDANDMIWQFDASRTFNPEPDLGKIKAKLLWVNSADDFVNPPEAGIVPRVAAKLKPDQFMLIPFGPDTVGHGTTMKPKFWKDRVAKLLAD